MTQARKLNLDVLAVRTAGRDYRWIHLAAPPDWRSQPGQFVNIRCDDAAPEDTGRLVDYDEDGPWPRTQGADLAAKTPLVRRPVSISFVEDHPDGHREIVLLLRVVGAGSQRLGRARPGDRVDLVGPIGNGFDLAAPGARAWLVGGGCGIAPLVGLARDLADSGKDVTVFYGCTDAENIPLELGPADAEAPEGLAILEAREMPGVRFVPATEDGSLGKRGLVTDAIAAMGEATGWQDVGLFACGPDVMMAAVAALARVADVPSCQVSLENYMGCALGVCLSCAVKLRADNEAGWVHRLVCRDGPVFQARDVIFESKWEGCKR